MGGKPMLTRVQMIGCPSCPFPSFSGASSRVEINIRGALFSIEILNAFIILDNIGFKFLEIYLKPGDFFMKIRQNGGIYIFNCLFYDFGKTTVTRREETSLILIEADQFSLQVFFSELYVTTSISQVFAYLFFTKGASYSAQADYRSRILQLSNSRFLFYANGLSLDFQSFSSISLLNCFIDLSNNTFEIRDSQINNKVFDFKYLCVVKCLNLTIIIRQNYCDNFTFFYMDYYNFFDGDGMILMLDQGQRLNSKIFSCIFLNNLRINRISLENFMQTNMVILI
jgi:hypothetical protein